MKTTFMRLIILLVTTIGFGSCTSNIDVSATKTKILPFLTGSWAQDNYSATFQDYKVVNKFSGPVSATQSLAVAYLYDTIASTSVDGGTVSINGSSLTKINNGAKGVEYLLNSTAGNTVPLIFNGSSHIFSVAGSGDFASMTDTVSSPKAEVNITSPTVSSSLPLSSGFTITWDVPSGTTSDIFIQIRDTSLANPYQVVTSDNGSYTITSGNLSAFHAGHVAVSVTRINSKDAVASGGRKYAIGVYSTEIINCALY